MTLQIISEEDSIDNRGIRKSDIRKLEAKKKEKLLEQEKTKDKTKDKYIYTMVWDSQQNRQRRTRVYLKNNEDQRI